MNRESWIVLLHSRNFSTRRTIAPWFRAPFSLHSCLTQNSCPAAFFSFWVPTNTVLSHQARYNMIEWPEIFFYINHISGTSIWGYPLVTLIRHRPIPGLYQPIYKSSFRYGITSASPTSYYKLLDFLFHS